MNKQLSIDFQIPKGFEVDMQKSDLSKGKIALKEIPQKLDYLTIVRKLRDKDPDSWYECSTRGNVVYTKEIGSRFVASDTKQLASLGALNMLNNVAKYFNDTWKPSLLGKKYMIGLKHTKPGMNDIKIIEHNTVQYSCVYFKTREHATQALEVLGEELVRKALTLNH